MIIIIIIIIILLPPPPLYYTHGTVCFLLRLLFLLLVLVLFLIGMLLRCINTKQTIAQIRILLIDILLLTTLLPPLPLIIHL